MSTDHLAQLEADIRLLDNIASIAAVPRETHVRAQEAARRLLDDIGQRVADRAAKESEKK